jgi:hypothetical protein
MHSNRTNGGAALLDEAAFDRRGRQVRERVDALDARIQEAVQERPLTAVGIALAVGYVVGRMLGGRARPAAPYLGAAAGFAGRLVVATLADRAMRRVSRAVNPLRRSH